VNFLILADNNHEISIFGQIEAIANSANAGKRELCEINNRPKIAFVLELY
jgi:hypothetical protein